MSFLLVSRGMATEIVGVDSDMAVDTWHSLTIRAEDERFMVSIDGNWLFTAYDPTLSRPGRIALWTNADAAIRFDRIAIAPLPVQEQR